YETRLFSRTGAVALATSIALASPPPSTVPVPVRSTMQSRIVRPLIPALLPLPRLRQQPDGSPPSRLLPRCPLCTTSRLPSVRPSSAPTRVSPVMPTGRVTTSIECLDGSPLSGSHTYNVPAIL